MSELNISADPLDILKAKLEDHELQEPEIITAPKIFYEDVSSEAFAYHIAIGHPSASLWSDEGGLFVASQGMKEDNAMGMFAIINRIWDGNDFEPTRKTAKTKRISGRRCTANIMLQQTVFEKWQGKQNDMSRAIGTSARFLTQRPKSTMGEREYQAPPERTPKMQTFHDRVRNIMETPLPMDDEGRLMPPVLQLSEEAKRIWTAYFNKVEESLKQGGEFAEVKDFASKTAEQAARISGVLHVFEFGPEGEIQPETMLQSINIAEWYLHEANRIFVTARLPEEFKNAFILQKWIKNHCQLSQLSQLFLQPYYEDQLKCVFVCSFFKSFPWFRFQCFLIIYNDLFLLFYISFNVCHIQSKSFIVSYTYCIKKKFTIIFFKPRFKLFKSINSNNIKFYVIHIYLSRSVYRRNNPFNFYCLYFNCSKFRP